MATDDQRAWGRYVCKARQGGAMRGKAQLPASSMQLTIAVVVAATGATVATATWPANGEHGDGLSKAWLWWIGKGVTGWRRTIADAAFASTNPSCCVEREKDWTDGQAGWQIDRQTISSNISVVDDTVWPWRCAFVRISSRKSWGVLVWDEGGCRGPVHLIVLSEPANGTRNCVRANSTALRLGTSCFFFFYFSCTTAPRLGAVD